MKDHELREKVDDLAERVSKLSDITARLQMLITAEGYYNPFFTYDKCIQGRLGKIEKKLADKCPKCGQKLPEDK